MEPPVAPADERQLDVVEVRRAASRIASRREHAQVRRVVLGRTAAEEAQPALHAERVRHGADEHAARAQHTSDLRDERVREVEVLEELAGDDGVEALVRRTAAAPRRSPAPARSRARPPSRARLRRRRRRRPRSRPGSAASARPSGSRGRARACPRPIASWKSGIRSGTKTKSPSFRRSRWCSS